MGVAAAVSVGVVYDHLRGWVAAYARAGASPSSLLLAVAALYPVLGAARQDRRPVRHLRRADARRTAFMRTAVFEDKG